MEGRVRERHQKISEDVRNLSKVAASPTIDQTKINNLTYDLPHSHEAMLYLLVPLLSRYKNVILFCNAKNEFYIDLCSV